jgi:hypothetical protein
MHRAAKALVGATAANVGEVGVDVGVARTTPRPPDPDDDALAVWLAQSECEMMIEAWQAALANPLPDDFAQLQRWYIEQRNIQFASSTRRGCERRRKRFGHKR